MSKDSRQGMDRDRSRGVETRGGYASSSKRVTDFPPPPRGPAPGMRRPETVKPEPKSA